MRLSNAEVPLPAESILADLKTVEAERLRREASPALLEKVVRLKAFQRARFARSYEDLLSTARYARAARFFLEELYGPTDFAQRDAQFARVVPALARLFSDDVVETVALLAKLHALSEQLDTAMAEVLPAGEINAAAYIAAWQRVGRAPSRAEQVSLAVRIAARLEKLTRRQLVRSSLLLMRAPARAAGLGQLQKFLEAGFEAFRAMGNAGEFISTLELRERAMTFSIFAVRSGDHLVDPVLAKMLEDSPN